VRHEEEYRVIYRPDRDLSLGPNEKYQLTNSRENESQKGETERERERESDRERETEREWDRESQRERDRERERKKETEIEKTRADQMPIVIEEMFLEHDQDQGYAEGGKSQWAKLKKTQGTFVNIRQ
jgi:hypothetical protein